MNPNRITDPRFTKIYKDPRFKSMSKKDKKVLVDKRFKGLFNDKSFSTKPKFDEYGDEFEPNNQDYQDHYELEEDDEQEEVYKDLANVSDESGEEDDDIESLMGADEWQEDEEPVPNIEEATHRLALQNYDWQTITAKDLMVLFTSFVPSGNAIKRVLVYQSNFGKQRINDELLHGPKEIFKEQSIPTYLQRNFTQEPEPKKNIRTAVREINELIIRGDQQDLDIDPNKLRKYEKDRLKYYFAVIECDSADTADIIYKSTQGQEFELSNIKIDLRFIPDAMEFTDQPFQECDKIVQKLSSKNILSRAVGHTNVKLTWEEHVPQVNFWQGKTEEELDKIDWTEYLGDCGDEDIENAEEFKEKLFGNKNEDADDWKQSFNKKSKASKFVYPSQEKRDFDIEITFNTGFNDGGNVLLERDDKKKKKNTRFAQALKSDDLFVGFDEPQPDVEGSNFKERKLIRQAKLREQRAHVKASQHNRAELELLVDSKPKRDEQPFDPNDRRFKAVFDDPQFAIDPTDRHFKKDTVGQIFKEQIKRKKVKQ